jgi:NAD(P)H-hydrate epimerase
MGAEPTAAPTPIRLTRAQVRDVDRLAIERYQIPGIVLMENAARGAAEVAAAMLGTTPGQRVLIVCGGGNNGGDGLAVGRHLHNRRHDVHLLLTTEAFKGEALTNWRIVQAMGLPSTVYADGAAIPSRPALLIDALFGTGLTRAIEGPSARLIGRMNESGIAILAIDVPSGLDCDTGRSLGVACVRATRTVTFVAEKVGFANPAAKPFLGDVTVADIGCPRELIDEVMRAGSPEP